MKYAGVTKKAVGFVLSPIIAAALSNWGWHLAHGEAVCYANLDIATPGLVCQDWFGLDVLVFTLFHLLLVLPVCALVRRVTRAYPGVHLQTAVIAVVSLAFILILATAIVLRSGHSTSEVNLLSAYLPACTGLLLPLLALPALPHAQE